MGGAVMGGFGVSKSESEQASGLRGSEFEGPAQHQAYNAGVGMSNLSNQLLSSPGSMLNYGRQMIPGGQYGLGENVDRGVEALGNYQFGQASKSGAMRGQIRPENITGILGSAIQNSLPFLIPQLQQHQYAQFQAPQGLMQTARGASDYWASVLGGKGNASAFGFNAAVGASK